MEEYLTVKELSDKIKFSRQSLYNLIHKGTFILGRHYLKPTPKKVLFKWSEIREWMGEEPQSNESTNLRTEFLMKPLPATPITQRQQSP